MRKSTLFLLGTTTAILATTLLAKRTEKPTDNFVWIDGDDPEDMVEPKPMFEIGDPVVVINPYTHDYAIVDIDGETPLYYDIQAMVYDESEKTFRYMLDGENDWYSESWLEFAPYPYMSKSLTDHSDIIMARIMSDERTEDIAEPGRLVEAERKIISQAMDDMVRRTQIDKCLDTLTHGSPEERAEAERMLTELTGGKRSE